MSATVEFFDRTMMEAMALLAETRRYLIDRSESERKGMPIETGLAASMESMRLVARLTQVLAWLLTHRAVHAGEMNLIEATRPDRRLGGRELCLNTQGEDDVDMPEELRNLLARSLATTLPATLLFDHPTLNALTQYMMVRLDLEVSRDDALPAASAEVSNLSEEEAEAQLLAELSAPIERSAR